VRNSSRRWARHDRLLAKRRARKEDNFREKSEDKEFGVHLVREDRQETFSAFCDEMDHENQRLTAECQADVAVLIRKHCRKAR
jgi:hypothetical protein